MHSPDGHRLLKRNNNIIRVKCSRWNELVDGLKFHIGLAYASNTISEFRFLNDDIHRVDGNSTIDEFNKIIVRSHSGINIFHLLFIENKIDFYY